MQTKNIWLIIGPSGSGKSTLEKDLVTHYSSEFKKAVSITTREPRKGEIDGEDYYFVNHQDIEEGVIPLIEKVEFAGNIYGLPVSETRTDKDLLVVVEPKGALQIKEWAKNHNINIGIIYFNIPKYILKENMKKRGDSIESIEKRMEQDKIKHDFSYYGLSADLIIRKVYPSLYKTVYEWIFVSKQASGTATIPKD